MAGSQPLPQALSPCSSGRRSSCDAKSPEFEFWMVRNPINFPRPNLLSADELFSGGFLLPLRLLQLADETPAPPDSEETGADQVPEPEPSTGELAAANSKRWRYIFNKSDKKRLDSSVGNGGDDRSAKGKDSISVVKEKKHEKKINGGGVAAASNVVCAAELNINIWPFSRSRSTGNGGNRPRLAAAATNRKVSSAPCSRSNSTGESKFRKWPNSPSRAGGVHLGRSSPVWQVRRGGSGGGRNTEAFVRNGEKGGKKDGIEGRRKIPAASARGGGGSKARVLSLNVPMCIGYRHNLSCKSDENRAVSIAAAAAGGGRGGQGGSQIGGGVAGEGVRRSNLFNFRSLFTKKVY